MHHDTRDILRFYCASSFICIWTITHCDPTRSTTGQRFYNTPKVSITRVEDLRAIDKRAEDPAYTDRNLFGRCGGRGPRWLLLTVLRRYLCHSCLFLMTFSSVCSPFVCADNFYSFFFLLVTETINFSDHYLRSCGYVTCSRPQRTATGGLEPGTSRPKVIGFTTAPVRSTISVKVASPPFVPLVNRICLSATCFLAHFPWLTVSVYLQHVFLHISLG